MTAISYVSRESIRHIIKKAGRKIGNKQVLVVETLAIRSALKHTIQENYSKVSIESDSLIAI